MAGNNNIMDMVRRFAGADPEAEDTVLEMCYRAAVAWYEEAGVPENQTNDLWKFWVCNLAAWMYDNRGNADPNAAVPIYIVTSVHQLRKPANTAGTGTSGTEQSEETQTGTEQTEETQTQQEAGEGT